MLELASMNALRAAEADPKISENDKRTLALAKGVAISLYLILLAWAFMRAMKCSANSPDSRAIHLAFAMFSPLLYIVFSFFVPGFCPPE